MRGLQWFWASLSYDLRLGAGSLLFCSLLLAACAPSPRANVIGYLVAKQVGTLPPPPAGAAGSLSGTVLHAGKPVPGVAVVVAERTGRPHSAWTGADGRYRIDGIPPGQYVPAAVGPGWSESIAAGLFGIPLLVTVEPDTVTAAADIEMLAHTAAPLPAPLPEAVSLVHTASFTATAPFPAGASARIHAYQFERAGAVVDTLRVYLPPDGAVDPDRPLLFFVYPGVVDGWQSVSVAFTAAGYPLVALSPQAAWGVDIDQHALDARTALALARSGALTPVTGNGEVIALGGSFSSAILHRLLRDEREGIAAWVTVGGMSDAFAVADDFYAGRIELPEQYAMVIPALGRPDLQPLSFLRYSPLYSASQLPPTMIVHTDADDILRIEQAQRLEEALRTAGVTVEPYYYTDVSHYLQIDDQMTDAGRTMYERILDFIQRYGTRRTN